MTTTSTPRREISVPELEVITYHHESIINRGVELGIPHDHELGAAAVMALSIPWGMDTPAAQHIVELVRPTAQDMVEANNKEACSALNELICPDFVATMRACIDSSGSPDSETLEAALQLATEEYFAGDYLDYLLTAYGRLRGNTSIQTLAELGGALSRATDIAEAKRNAHSVLSQRSNELRKTHFNRAATRYRKKQAQPDQTSPKQREALASFSGEITRMDVSDPNELVVNIERHMARNGIRLLNGHSISAMFTEIKKSVQSGDTALSEQSIKKMSEWLCTFSEQHYDLDDQTIGAIGHALTIVPQRYEHTRNIMSSYASIIQSFSGHLSPRSAGNAIYGLKNFHVSKETKLILEAIKPHLQAIDSEQLNGRYFGNLLYGLNGMRPSPEVIAILETVEDQLGTFSGDLSRIQTGNCLTGVAYATRSLERKQNDNNPALRIAQKILSSDVLKNCNPDDEQDRILIARTVQFLSLTKRWTKQSEQNEELRTTDPLLSVIDDDLMTKLRDTHHTSSGLERRIANLLNGTRKQHGRHTKKVTSAETIHTLSGFDVDLLIVPLDDTEQLRIELDGLTHREPVNRRHDLRGSQVIRNNHGIPTIRIKEIEHLGDYEIVAKILHRINTYKEDTPK